MSKCPIDRSRSGPVTWTGRGSVTAMGSPRLPGQAPVWLLGPRAAVAEVEHRDLLTRRPCRLQRAAEDHIAGVDGAGHRAALRVGGQQVADHDRGAGFDARLAGTDDDLA